MDIQSLIADRCREIDASGIRRVFELGAKLRDPINLSIGQPDFPVPDIVKRAAIEAIDADRNGYSLTQGIPALRRRVSELLTADLGWPAADESDDVGLFITSGTSGGLLLVFLAILNPGDEVIIPDPWFVVYPHMATLAGARAIPCDTYPDFRMTAERIEPLITDRTRAVLLNSPGNPSGVVLTSEECDAVRRLCDERGVLLITDEIYDEFCYPDARVETPAGPRCPSPARADGAWANTLLVRGFGKTYGCTGWRMGYVAGPRALIEEMAKLQQYTFVCAPTPLQHGCLATFEHDMAPVVEGYARRRDMVMERLGAVTEVAPSGGAFYAFVKIPERLGLSGAAFCDRALEQNILVIPGGVFSGRDTHFRLSYAVAPGRLEQGLDGLAELLSG
ncbi:MAG: aminotransferase class I/II-fold pyridoxal phosphate-dependent enzyme [Phycisphaerales bacterium]